MGLAAGSTAAVAFEPAGPGSPLPAPPNAGADARLRGQEVYGSHVCGSGSCRVEDPPWGQFRSPEVQQWGERALHWPPGRSVPWVRVHLCTVDPDTCAAEGDLHIQGKDVKILEGPEELPDGEVRLSASDWLREWQGGVVTVPESARLYDEEAARVASAGPFVLPPARGATEGAEVGQRLAVLEGQILRDLEGGDQCGVRRTTSGEKGLTLPAVPTPPLPEPGEEVVQQSREAVTRTPEDRKSLLRVRLEGVRAAFNATKPRRLHHGGRKHVLRTMATRAMIFVVEGEERERKRTRKDVHTRRQQERKRKSLSTGSSARTSESDTSNSETAMGRGSRSKIMRAV